MANPEYAAYCRSQKWAELKDGALARAQGRCQLCNSDDGLHVHHRCYPDVLGTEPVSDLTVLCGNCHITFHSLQWRGKIVEQKNRKAPGNLVKERVGRVKNTKKLEAEGLAERRSRNTGVSTPDLSAVATAFAGETTRPFILRMLEEAKNKSPALYQDAKKAKGSSRI